MTTGLQDGILNVDNASSSRTNLGLGTAATKTASNNSNTIVASVSGTITSGHVATFADTSGTVQDGGATSQFLLAANNLSDVNSIVTSRFNISTDYGYDNTTYINLNSNTTMSNPLVTYTDISFLSGSLSLTLPAMNTANSMGRSGNGRTFLLRNIGGNAFTLKDNAGTTLISSVPINYIIELTLVDNSNAHGSFVYDVKMANGTALPLALGGTNANITASNGGIVYTNATQMQVISGTATANQVLLSGASSQPSFSTATYPITTTINRLLYSSANNTIVDLATVNSNVLTTNASGVPTWVSTIGVTNGGTGLATTTAYGLITGGTTATGNFQNAGTGTSGQIYISGGSAALGTWTTPTYTGVLFTQTQNVNVNNTLTQTTLVGTGVGSVTLASNFFVAGKTLRLQAWGFMSTSGTPTLNITTKYGNTNLGTSGAQATANNTSNAVWQLESLITCYTTGTTGTVWNQGLFYYSPTNGGAPDIIDFGNTAVTTINTTTSNAINLLVQWGTQSSSNTITCTNLVLEQLN